jgi:hypothetical protein
MSPDMIGVGVFGKGRASLCASPASRQWLQIRLDFITVLQTHFHLG